MVKYRLDPKKPPKLTPGQRMRLKAMTDAEITAAAGSDPDNPPLTDAELARISTARTVRRIRDTLGLSQAEFARRYRINQARLRDWEQARVRIDSVSLAYLTVIEREPKAVERALKDHEAA